MRKLLEVENLKVSFYIHAGEVQAVKNVSFDIEKGETVAIVGESGCGKSVTSKTIMGLLSSGKSKVKDGSKIMFEGQNLLEFTEKDWKNFRGKECAMIFQDALTALNPTLTVGRQVIENLKNHTSLKKEEQYHRAVEILEKVGIPDAGECMKKYPFELSGGMRQRVMIASAIICEPKLLIADEPTTALDVTIQTQVLKLMKEVQKSMDMAILLITHDLGVVAQMADKIIVMYAGEAVEMGSPEDIYYHSRHPYTKALLHSVPQIGDRKEKLVSIEGNLPSTLYPPKGCVFADRCKECMNICQKEHPRVQDLNAGHQAACWLTEKEKWEEMK